MKAIVLVNAYIRSEGMIRQAERVAEELRARGCGAEIRKNGNFPAGIRGGEISFEGERPDFIVYLDKDKYLPRMLERAGLRLFNSAESVELCDDKMLTGIRLAGEELKLPDTLPAPLCYYADAVLPEGYARRIGDILSWPVVVKKSFGSWGAEVRLAKNEAELSAAAEELRMCPHLYQKFVGKAGEDCRILVVGGRAVAAMRRKNEHDFRSNIERGGHGERVQPPEAFLRAAERCAAVLGLDYCGVDILDEKGEPYICEVNSNALFNEAERVTGVNIAGAFAEHMLTEMDNYRTRNA